MTSEIKKMFVVAEEANDIDMSIQRKHIHTILYLFIESWIYEK